MARYSEHRLLSRPVELHWAGWRSDTLALQQCGWDIAVEFEPFYMRYRLLLHHEMLDLHCLTEAREIDSRETQNWKLPPFRVLGVGRRLEVLRVSEDMNLAKFDVIDARPIMMETKIERAEDFNIFYTPVRIRNEQVLVDKADMTVIEHLEAIKRMQSAKQRELREKLQRAPAERPERGTPRLHLVAQLVHLEEVA